MQIENKSNLDPNVKALVVDNLSLSFLMYGKGLKKRDNKVIDNLSLDIKQGELVAVIGASGSGKSLLAHAILGILPSNVNISGEMKLYGEVLDDKLRKETRGSEMVLVPQMVTHLDPLMPVGKLARDMGVSKEKQRKMFSRYQLDESVDKLYPFELSGGMARRVLISTSLLGGARLIIADEPTPGLSLDQAKEVMKHFRQLADEGHSVLLITHDIDVALAVADRLCVFYKGRSIDILDAKTFIEGGDAIKHPYTRALWEALPQNGFKAPTQTIEELANGEGETNEA